MNFDKGCTFTCDYEIVTETESYILCRCIRCGGYFKSYK